MNAPTLWCSISVSSSAVALAFEGVYEDLGYIYRLVPVDESLAGFDESSEYLEVAKSSHSLSLSLQDDMDVVAAALIDVNLQLHRLLLFTLAHIVAFI